MARYNNNNNNHNHHHATKVLNVAEKPSVARALAGVFNRMPGSREGGMRREAAQIFTHEQVSFPSIFSQRSHNSTLNNSNSVPHTMVTTSVRGHLSNIDFPQDFGWSRCDPIVLFTAPLEVIYKDKPLKQMLTRLSRQVDAVILWLDCDREGEAIGDEVRQVCLEGNQRLQIYRAKFSTVLDGEIRRALYTLGRLNDNFVQAVQARMQLDLRVGAAFTRFQTLRLQKKFQGYDSGSGNSVVSYGPCQFPTLGFVVERWARIETFVPENFWFLEMTLQIPSSNNANESETIDAGNRDTSINNSNNEQVSRPITFSWERNRLYDRLLTATLYEACFDAERAVVTKLVGRPKNKWRPVPLATVELQKRASRYLRIGSETLMTAAEELYHQGYISYPRTETERFRPEFQHHPLIQQFQTLGVEPYTAYANQLMHQNGFQAPRAGQHDDQAHPPITPAKVVDPQSIKDPTQRGVYTLVVKHYLACCSRDAVGKETIITVKMASEQFTAKGLMITEKNWLQIYEPWERWSTGQGELPHVEVGSRIVPNCLLMKDGRTTPPSPISEVELISLMDRNGIGTDATIAQHITTIQERSYATKNAAQQFLPTPLGIALVEGYNSMGYQLNKPDLRREVEHECSLVANGRKTKDDIVGPILQKMKLIFEKATLDAHKLDQAMARQFPRLGVDGGGNNQRQYTVIQQNFSECGVCNSQMALKQERNNNNGNNRTLRKLLFCSRCQTGWSLPRGRLSPKTSDRESGIGGNSVAKCLICNFQVVKVSQGEGYQGNGYHFCPKCFTDVPAEHSNIGGVGDFRCFQCSHPTCTIATGGGAGSEGGGSAVVEVFACPFCDRRGVTGKVCIKKNSRGFILSCQNYQMARIRCSYTIWLPRATSNITVVKNSQGDTQTESTCARCSSPSSPVRRVQFLWKHGDTPPHIGRESSVCILCDAAFRQDMQINLPQMEQVLTNNRRAANQLHPSRRGVPARRDGNNRTNSSVVGGGRAREGGTEVCYRCLQPGHYANACPTTT